MVAVPNATLLNDLNNHYEKYYELNKAFSLIRLKVRACDLSEPRCR